MAEFTTFGETMMVFSPFSSGPLRYNPCFFPKIAGAESNTAVGIRKLGHTAEWISGIGSDEMGKFLLNSLRAEGVSVDHVLISSDHPTGIMVKELHSGSETRVNYYRENSAFTTLRPADISADCFKDTKIFHCTGITPILSYNTLDTLNYILDLCTTKGIFISFDPNIRTKLWKGNSYIDLLTAITKRTSCLLLGIEEANILFHKQNPETISNFLFQKFPHLQYLALKNGSKGAYVSSRNEFIFIPPWPCHCTDPIGAGDAFNAGFLSGLLENRSLKECGQIAAICGALCTETAGDIEGIPDREQLLKYLNHTQETYR